MIQRFNSSWMILFVAAFGLAACGGDAGETASEAVAQMPAAESNPCAATENPCVAESNPCAAAENPCAAAENPCAAMQELPEGVTMAMVEEGKALFGGIGICMSWHMADGTGVPNLGADLTDDEWVHSDGSYDGIVKTVVDGVSADASSTGIPMPPKGGSAISDDQAKAVSAYVWTLSQ